MTAFVKKYPRARISTRPNIKGWVIDLIFWEGAKPKRVAATYASIPWAYKSAHEKLGVNPTTTTAPKPAPAPAEPALRPKRTRSSNGFRAKGTCGTCNRPMRPAGTKASDHPGTTLRQREGLCQSCNARATREGAA